MNIKDKMSSFSKETLEKYIKVYDSALTDSECNFILNEYSKSNEWSVGKISNAEVDKNIRNCDMIGISYPDVINLNPKIRNQIDQTIFNASNKIIKNYIEEFPYCKLTSDSGYDLLRYCEGQYLRTHTDSSKQNPRTISCSFNLNDGYEGGEFSFFNGEIIVKLSKGSAILFPSNFMYPHEILDIKKGVRYSIITWFI